MINVLPEIYEKLVEAAARVGTTPDLMADAVLREYLADRIAAMKRTDPGPDTNSRPDEPEAG